MKPFGIASGAGEPELPSPYPPELPPGPLPGEIPPEQPPLEIPGLPPEGVPEFPAEVPSMPPEIRGQGRFHLCEPGVLA